MVDYINRLFPFLEDGDFIKSSDETLDIGSIYFPTIYRQETEPATSSVSRNGRFHAVRVLPCNVVLLNESEKTVSRIMDGRYSSSINVEVMEYDYTDVASRIEVSDRLAYIFMNRGYQLQEVDTDTLITCASNGVETTKETLDSIQFHTGEERQPVPAERVEIHEWMDRFSEEMVLESADAYADLLKDARAGKNLRGETPAKKDTVYQWLDSYFALPEGQEMKSGGREVVPLLIGPTGVFKSATIKELCKKYDYRLVDFRVAFTSRLDYSGLFQMGEVDGQKYSYSCPMEEIVTCSDGFREYCRRAHAKISQIISDGRIAKSKASNGESEEVEYETLSEEQIDSMKEVLAKYAEYMKTPVLFFDEITRCFSEDTKVRLVDGRILSMKELYEEFGEDKPFYVYSCDPAGNVRFVPAYSRGVTRRNARMVKVILDNGSEVICTPDHRWMLRDGSYEQAQHFECGRSLMGTYFGTHKFNNGKFSSEYETYINPSDMKTYMTHQEVARQYDTLGIYGTQDENGDYYQVHHKDLNSRNNSPDNLIILPRKDHRDIHNICGESNYNRHLMNTCPEYAAWARLGFERARESCSDFMDRQMEALEPIRKSLDYRMLRHNIGVDTHSSDEYRERQSSRCKEQWDRGDFNFNREESLKKNHLERCIRFIRILKEVGYNVTEDNYDKFVDLFTGNHGVYYSVMKLNTIKNNIGIGFDDLIEIVESRDWDNEVLHELDDWNIRRSRALPYNPRMQEIADNPSIDDIFRDRYPDVNLKNAHVRGTLSYLNTLGDITEEQYEDALESRDHSKWHNVLTLSRLKAAFGSFSRAKELSSVYNHKVVRVEWLDDTMDAYDIEVPSFHNFLVDLGDDSGVFVHNCKDAGVEGLLTEMLNQKRFNNMTMNGCKFVAATNLNLMNSDSRHNAMMSQLDDMYDVNTDLDVAYSNRFLPLRVQPEDVVDRWFEWAESDKSRFSKTVSHIHPMVLEYLKSNRDMIYNDTPVLNAIDQGLTENEQKAQSFPNYRTWEMASDYMYRIDDDNETDKKDDPKAPKLYRRTILNGLISDWAASSFIDFLESKGYRSYESVKGEVVDEYSDFLSSSLDAGVPALMVGPSSIGKTSRVKAYQKKVEKQTGLKPLLINIDLSSKDVVDLMGMPSKVSLTDYVMSDAKGSVPRELKNELNEIVQGVVGEGSYGLTDTLTVRAPDKTVKDDLNRARDEGREVIFFIDECNRVKNSSVLSAIFELSSDSRYGGIDFSDMKDRVKIVAACNMAHSEMSSEMGDYGSAGSIDPALAARFSVFWKKNYDENDVKSWIEFMEEEKKEGKIDGTVLEFFKTLDPRDALRFIASVEKRQLAYAEPSTRNLHQLSMDIKSMRYQGIPGSSEGSHMFYGKLLFDDTLRNELGNINEQLSSSTSSIEATAQQISDLIGEVAAGKDSWESNLKGTKVTLGGRELTAGDIIDNLVAIKGDIDEAVLKPLTQDGRSNLETLCNLALSLLVVCNDLDTETSESRNKIFESYVGEEFASRFTPYFDEKFGSPDDTEITIEMLKDTKLIKPFFRQYRAKNTGMTESAYEDSMIPLMREFLNVHGTSLPDQTYTDFVDGVRASLASADGMTRILKQADVSLDPLFERAEKAGDSWILGMLTATNITQNDINDLRQAMSQRSQGSKGRSRRSVVL